MPSPAIRHHLMPLHPLLAYMLCYDKAAASVVAEPTPSLPQHRVRGLGPTAAGAGRDRLHHPPTAQPMHCRARASRRRGRPPPIGSSRRAPGYAQTLQDSAKCAHKWHAARELQYRAARSTIPNPAQVLALQRFPTFRAPSAVRAAGGGGDASKSSKLGCEEWRRLPPQHTRDMGCNTISKKGQI